MDLVVVWGANMCQLVRHDMIPVGKSVR